MPVDIHTLSHLSCSLIRTTNQLKSGWFFSPLCLSPTLSNFSILVQIRVLAVAHCEMHSAYLTWFSIFTCNHHSVNKNKRLFLKVIWNIEEKFVSTLIILSVCAFFLFLSFHFLSGFCLLRGTSMWIQP